MVRKIDSGGNEQWAYVDETHQWWSVAVDINGYVYAGSNQEGRLLMLDPDGEVVWFEDIHNNRIWNIIVEPGDYAAFPDAWPQ